MVEFVNEFVSRKGIRAAKNYTQFAREQVNTINKEIASWLKRQAFAENAPDPRYEKVKIDGCSNYSFNGEEYPDRVQWTLSFGNKTAKILDDKLLHVKRLPDKTKLHSAPQIMHTGEYLQIDVSNGERGWVAQGKFPQNTHIDNVRIYTDPLLTRRGINAENKAVAVYTNIRRDARAGFELAVEWAKFRAMAVASSPYLIERLRKESPTKWDHNEDQLMRSRSEATVEMFLDLLPDTVSSKTLAAIKPFYTPGVLESTVALEMERAVHPNFGMISAKRPLYTMPTGMPIEISPNYSQGKNSEYSAIIPFRIDLPVERDTWDGDLKGVVQNNIKKYFNAKVCESPSIEVRILVPEARKTIDEIVNGKTTSLHSTLSDLRESLLGIYESARYWEEDQLPALKAGYDAMLSATRESHFQNLIRTLQIDH